MFVWIPPRKRAGSPSVRALVPTCTAGTLLYRSGTSPRCSAGRKRAAPNVRTTSGLRGLGCGRGWVGLGGWGGGRVGGRAEGGALSAQDRQLGMHRGCRFQEAAPRSVQRPGCTGTRGGGLCLQRACCAHGLKPSRCQVSAHLEASWRRSSCARWSCTRHSTQREQSGCRVAQPGWDWQRTLGSIQAS